MTRYLHTLLISPHSTPSQTWSLISLMVKLIDGCPWTYHWRLRMYSS